MLCLNCGKEQKIDARFCYNCGKQLVGSEIATAAESSLHEKQMGKPAKTKIVLLRLAIIVVLWLLQSVFFRNELDLYHINPNNDTRYAVDSSITIYWFLIATLTFILWQTKHRRGWLKITGSTCLFILKQFGLLVLITILFGGTNYLTVVVVLVGAILTYRNLSRTGL